MPTQFSVVPQPDILPHNLEAERAVLGSILLDNSVLAVCTETLEVVDFYSEANGLILQAMKQISDLRRPIDHVSLSEHLQRKGLLEKVGGPVYLATLTDTVPIGTTTALPEYLRIVREKSGARKVINTLKNVIAHAFNGGSNELPVLVGNAYEHIGKLQALYASPEVEAPPAPDKSSPPPKERYPKIAPEAWHPAAELYRQAVQESSESSDNWHFISFYTTLGALLGDTVYGQMGSLLYPNIYSVLVGMVGGDGKSTSVSFCFNFARMVDERVYIPRTIDSKAGFVKAWALYNQQNGIKTNARAILRMGELRALLDTAAQTGTHSIIPLLNDAYDGEPLSNESVATPYTVEKPRLAAIFASAYRYLHEMKAVDLETGFGRRLCFCPGDPKPPKPYPDPPKQELLIKLAAQVKDVLDFWTLRENHKLGLSPSARKLWTTWYKKYKRRLAEDDVISSMSIGDRTSVQKVALINAALDRSPQFVEAEHLERAIEFGEYLYESRFPLFSEHGSTQDLEIDQKLLAKIPEFPGRILRRTLQKSFHLDARTFNRHLDDLSVPGSEVVKAQEGTRIWVWRVPK
jgi:hypothetical protein